MAWDSTTLTTVAALEKEVGEFALLLPGASSDTAAAAYVTDAIELAGTLITSELTKELPNLFVTTAGAYPSLRFGDWIAQQGFTYTDLDTILDSITNASVLQPWATAYALNVLFNRLITLNAANYAGMANIWADQRDYWEKQAKQRKASCLPQVTIDLSGDATIQDFERVQTHTTYFRV